MPGCVGLALRRCLCENEDMNVLASVTLVIAVVCIVVSLIIVFRLRSWQKEREADYATVKYRMQTNADGTEAWVYRVDPSRLGTYTTRQIELINLLFGTGGYPRSVQDSAQHLDILLRKISEQERGQFRALLDSAATHSDNLYLTEALIVLSKDIPK